METTIKHALSQATAADMVDVLLNAKIHPSELSDVQRGRIIGKWLSEDYNASDFGEVCEGFGRDHIVLITKFVGVGDFLVAGTTLASAMGQAPYGGDILDLIVDKVERENEIKRALA